MKKTSIAHLRREYRTRGLVEKKAPRNPIPLFQRWFREALKAKVLDANACAVSTVSAAGRPSTRMVLLKDFSAKGFIFFTNYQSQKGRELQRRPVASLLFFWPQLGRQVRVDGRVQKLRPQESEAYFKTRPRGSQLGAWASDQSRIVGGREDLEKRMERLILQYKGRVVPRPKHWGGYRVIPSAIEFWKGRPNRLHDRLLYRKTGGRWARVRLAP